MTEPTETPEQAAERLISSNVMMCDPGPNLISFSIGTAGVAIPVNLHRRGMISAFVAAALAARDTQWREALAKEER